MNTFESFLTSNTKRVGDCLEWTGLLGPGGYGMAYFEGKTIRAHRLVFKKLKGKIKKGFLICHTCDNRKCVEIKHLFQGTHQDNVDDMMKKNRYSKHVKLTRENVLEIRELLKSGKSIRKIAKMFSVVHSTIFKIKSGKSWKFI